jgi:hypothetical protein
VGEAAVKQLVALGTAELIMSRAVKNKRDVWGVLFGEEDGYELTVFALGVVKLLRNDVWPSHVPPSPFLGSSSPLNRRR